MLGEVGSGKTTLFKKFAALSKGSTLSESILSLNYEYSNIKYDLRIIDCFGKFDTTTDSVYWKWVADSDLFIFVYDMTSMASFERVIEFHKFVTKVKKMNDIPMVVIANKKDKENERKVNKQLGQRLANNVSSHYTPPNNNNKEANPNTRTNKHSFLEVSATTGNDERQILDAAVIEAVKYVGTGVPHKFELKYFLGPTWCKYCGNFIFGVVSKQGFWCNDCKYTAHRKCVKLVPNNCGSTIATKEDEHFDPHQSVRISELLTDEDLAETLQDEATRKRFTNFVNSQETPEEIMKQLDFWVECEEYTRLTSKEDRKAKGQTIEKKFFSSSDSMRDLRLDSDVVTKLKQKLSTGHYDADIFAPAQQGVIKQMEQQVFPKFISQEFHKCISGQIQVQEVAPEEVVEPEEEEESYSSGTFVAKEVDEEVVSEAIKEINIKEAEQWEKNILALEKGEFVEEMNPLAFKKYVRTRGRLPSVMIRAASEDSVLTPASIIKGLEDEVNRAKQRQGNRTYASRSIDKSL